MRKLFILLSMVVSVQAEPQNIMLQQQALFDYYDSGHYNQDVTRVINQAEQDLRQSLQSNKSDSEKLAIVLDIDETSLSNYPDMAKQHFSGDMEQLEKDIHAAHAPVIKQTLQLYKFAKAHHVAVFFVTGRREHERQLTIDNLKRAGYSDWAGIYFKPEKYSKHSVVPYKSSTRKQISEAGYKILANIGDQQSDLDGGYALHAYKLPGPFYYIA